MPEKRSHKNPTDDRTGPERKTRAPRPAAAERHSGEGAASAFETWNWLQRSRVVPRGAADEPEDPPPGPPRAKR